MKKILVLLFTVASLSVSAQDFINKTLDYGEIVEFESSGVKYKLFNSAATNACFLLNMLTQNCIVEFSRNNKYIRLAGDFVITKIKKNDNYGYFDIYNLQGKLIYTTEKNVDYHWPRNKNSYATNTCLAISSTNDRYGLLSIDGTILLPLIYSYIEVIDFKNKIWEVTSNDGVYIFDENTRKLSSKDGKEIVKAKLPQIKGYDFITAYDFKDSSKNTIKLNDCLVNEIGNDLWFVFDVAKATSGIYNNKSAKWIVNPDLPIIISKEKNSLYPALGSTDYLSSLKHSAEISTAYKNKDFFLINHCTGYNKKTKTYSYKCTVFDENKILTEVPFYVNKQFSAKLLNYQKKSNYFIIQDFSRTDVSKNTSYYSWPKMFNYKVEIDESSNYKDGDYGFGIASADGTILLKPEYRLVKFLKLKDKNFINFDAPNNSNSSITTFEILEDGKLVQNPDYENIITNKHFGIDNNFKFNVLSIKKNGKWGLVNEQNEELIPFVSDKPILYYFGNFYSTEFEKSVRTDWNYSVYSRSGEFIGKFESVNMNKDGGVHLLDRDKNESFDVYFDKKNNKVIKGENEFLAWKKDRIEFEKNNPSAFNDYVNITNPSSSTMSKAWIEETKTFLSHFENFSRECGYFQKSTTNKNKKEVQYWLDNLKLSNNRIIDILNKPNDKSIPTDEIKQYKAIAQQKKEDLNSFQKQLNNGVYTALDAILYKLK